jgi:glycosyltransferase involved in cell wall biosynthesis
MLPIRGYSSHTDCSPTKDTVKVSVIIPTWNRLSYLQEAIASVQRQTYRKWEMIIIDDASDDGTSAWLTALADPRIRSFRLDTRRERSAARNHGLGQARGELVMFLDDDDLLEPHALQYLSGALEGNPDAVATVGARVYFDQSGNRSEFRLCHWRTKRVIWPEVLFGLVPGQGEALIRKKAAIAAGGWNEHLAAAEDHDFWLRLAKTGSVVFIPDVVFRLRMHGGQTRLVGVRHKEQGFRARFVEMLPPQAKGTGGRILRANRAVLVARLRAARGYYWKALANWFYAVTAAPELLCSPVTSPSLIALAMRWLVSAIFGKAVIELGRRAKKQMNHVLG